MAGDWHHSFGAACKEVEGRLERSPQLGAAHAPHVVLGRVLVVSMTMSWWHVRHVLLGTRGRASSFSNRKMHFHTVYLSQVASVIIAIHAVPRSLCVPFHLYNHQSHCACALWSCGYHAPSWIYINCGSQPCSLLSRVSVRSSVIRLKIHVRGAVRTPTSRVVPCFASLSTAPIEPARL